MKKQIPYFTKAELALWGASSALIVVSFLLFDRSHYITLTASLVGAASLIFSAKGSPIGQALMIVFSLLYGIISYTFSYFGEMITYLGMTAPMAVFALITWLRNPFGESTGEVAVNRLKPLEGPFMLVLTVGITTVFYFILDAFDTANILMSTLSVATTFLAVYLTFRRSPYFPLAYAANDGVLIVLWAMAAAEDPAYLSVLVCFLLFLVNDLYGFVNWQRMAKRQLQMG